MIMNKVENLAAEETNVLLAAVLLNEKKSSTNLPPQEPHPERMPGHRPSILLL